MSYVTTTKRLNIQLLCIFSNWTNIDQSRIGVGTVRIVQTDTRVLGLIITALHWAPNKLNNGSGLKEVFNLTIFPV